MEIFKHVAEHLPSAEKLSTIFQGGAPIILFLALAHLAYGVAHLLADILADRKSPIARFVYDAARAVIILVIYTIAGLYAIEYIIVGFVE
jgi:succinate dehydrogenase hydrophobic anchor subunit